MKKFDQSKYIQEYAKNKYKRVPLDMKKEDYEIALEHSKRKGYNSFNAYIKDLIKKDIESSGGISVGNINQQGNNNSINIG